MRCRQCGAFMHEDSPSCWNCQCPATLNAAAPLSPQVMHRLGLSPSRALARRPGWWQMPDAELEQLGRGHLALQHALNGVYPTQALMDCCYETLRRHGIEPASVR